MKGTAEDDFQIAAMSVSKTKATEPLTTEEDITSLLDKDPDLNPRNQPLRIRMIMQLSRQKIHRLRR